MDNTVAQVYRRFADREAQGVSGTYFEWASSIAGDPAVLKLIAGLPGAKRQPNLVFGAARFVGAPVGPYGAFRDWLIDSWEDVLPVILSRSTQTNEAARCAVLLPILSRLKGPLALIEAGASAGLCLYPDRYSYRYTSNGTTTALDPAAGASAVVLPCSIDAGSVPQRLPEVVWRAGVDLNPIAAEDPDGRAWLRALVWPEHDERRERLEAALRLAAADPPRVVQGDLLEKVGTLIAEAPRDAHTVVFHSAVLIYLDPEGRDQFSELLRSTPDVTWISNEGQQVLPRVAEQLAGDGLGRTVLAVNERPVALTGPHGQSYEALEPGGTGWLQG